MIFDDTKISFHCPKCQQEMFEKIVHLKTNPEIPCPKCGVVIAVNGSQIAAGQEPFEKGLEEIRSAIKRINQ